MQHQANRSQKHLLDKIVYLPNHQPLAMLQIEKTCQQCHKTLHGRSDQRFCNDTCRNTFNRVKRQQDKIDDHQNTPEILRIIKKNYEILKSHSKRPLIDQLLNLPSKTLIDAGLNPKFYTSSFTDGQGTEWKCVFERCYSMSDTQSFIQDFPEQAEC